jgi:hypothetical protein
VVRAEARPSSPLQKPESQGEFKGKSQRISLALFVTCIVNLGLVSFRLPFILCSVVKFWGNLFFYKKLHLFFVNHLKNSFLSSPSLYLHIYAKFC